MKILIADKFAESARDMLAAEGHEVVFDPELKDGALLSALGEHNPKVLVVRSTKVTTDMLNAPANLALVVRAGAGVNTIDIATASKLGIYVSNCPGKNAVAVAELAIGLMLAVDRRIPDNAAQLREGLWNKKEFGKARGIKGCTLGLIGLGAIGKEVASRAKALEMEVIAWSRSLTEKTAKLLGVGFCSSPLEVARNSDIVSVHVAVTGDTKGLCNSDFFSAMKDGAFFINTSRGEVVDEGALIDAMNKKAIRAGLDVFCNEPAAGSDQWKSDLSAHPFVVGTHHIGASTEQATTAIGDEALRVIQTFASTGEVLNCVNLEDNPPASHIMSVRHANRVGVLAKVLHEVQLAGINVLNMENQLFQGDEAATATIGLDKEPTEAVRKAICAASDAIISVSVQARN